MKKPQRFSQTLSPQGGKRIDARGLAKNSFKILRIDFLPTLRQRGILRHTPFCGKNSSPLLPHCKLFLTKWECRKNARCRTSTLFRHFISPLPQPLAPRRGEQKQLRTKTFSTAPLPRFPHFRSPCFVAHGAAKSQLGSILLILAYLSRFIFYG